jgi:predicted nucleotidyltransferase
MDYRLTSIVDNQPYPLLFAALSGAHLYGFPSPNSDYDLRGVHVLPIQEVIGLYSAQETIEISEVIDGLELDLVTHDIKKFFSLLLKRNGYVLEQIYSPLIIDTTPEHEEIKAIASNCITRHHSHHYLGFARTQWRLFNQQNPPRVKPLLYVYRVLLTGIYLMQTGKIEANLVSLNRRFNLSYITDLIALKLAGEEKSTISTDNLDFYAQEYQRLIQELEIAATKTHLPDAPKGKKDLNDLLLRVRLSFYK